jgi:hypothetical protein
MNDPSTKALLARQPYCIFCGGGVLATTREHCPPRGLFEAKVAPEGFVFSACEECNGGTSDEDLLVALMSQFNPRREQPSGRVEGLLRATARQAPTAIPRLLSATQARQAARAAGLRPAKGQLYQDLPIAEITPPLEEAIKSLARKLTKAVYFQQTGKIFPANGAVLLRRFSNIEMHRGEAPPAIAAFRSLPRVALVLRRNGRDLGSQCAISVTGPGDAQVILVQAIFHLVFGFVSLGVTDREDAERFVADSIAKRPPGRGGAPPLRFI